MHGHYFTRTRTSKLMNKEAQTARSVEWEVRIRDWGVWEVGNEEWGMWGVGMEREDCHWIVDS